MIQSRLERIAQSKRVIAEAKQHSAILKSHANSIVKWEKMTDAEFSTWAKAEHEKMMPTVNRMAAELFAKIQAGK